ncbi:hypothetical protein ANANG_G00071600 [Anguilla anguilla]|uniref:Calponin-homology (CH) domain-containing protein n=1 Tax=Anguilla anguilla TaxID=7936 RepID=A0A9D3MSL3_ANGAN|nr:hypothetical protein ANANG_G00071600 [Anguilla anguilla]
MELWRKHRKQEVPLRQWRRRQEVAQVVDPQTAPPMACGRDPRVTPIRPTPPPPNAPTAEQTRPFRQKLLPPLDKPRSPAASCSEPPRCNVKTSDRTYRLRKTLESRLKLTLPDDLGEALSNGTILCQLANHVRPRSVSIIHIPSPAVPKLSGAKCRLNVENFITACRKLGVPEADLCLSSDVLSCKLPAVIGTVEALLRRETPPPPPCSPLSPGFLLFYFLAMALLYLLYCQLTA